MVGWNEACPCTEFFRDECLKEGRLDAQGALAFAFEAGQSASAVQRALKQHRSNDRASAADGPLGSASLGGGAGKFKVAARRRFVTNRGLHGLVKSQHF